MAFNGSSRSTRNPSECGTFASISPAYLAIACTRFPYLLHPRNLTPAHIAAILIHTRHFTPSFPPATDITGPTILSQTNKLIRRAFAYGEYHNSLTPAQKAERDIPEHFVALGWYASEGINLEEFAESVRSWHFIQKLDDDGVDARMRVLEFGWRAYDRVSEKVKRGLGLVDGGGEESGGE